MILREAKYIRRRVLPGVTVAVVIVIVVVVVVDDDVVLVVDTFDKVDGSVLLL